MRKVAGCRMDKNIKGHFIISYYFTYPAWHTLALLLTFSLPFVPVCFFSKLAGTTLWFLRLVSSVTKIYHILIFIPYT